MEDRERALLAQQVLADLLVEAETEPLGDPQLLTALADLSMQSGPDAVLAFLLRCAAARDAWIGPGAWQEPLRPRLLTLLGLPADADDAWLAAMCEDARFDVVSLRRCLDVNHDWATKTGLGAVDAISEWLLGTPGERAASIETLGGVFLTQKGEMRAMTSQLKIDPEYGEYCARVVGCIEEVRAARALLALAERLLAPLRLGRAFALAWDEAKQREGLIDFDDQIRRAASLLRDKDQADWIRYKLDRQFDHILVDEAQDTNAAQWSIIFAMAEEFWSGLGARGEVMRTLFVVGDYKQAIFRFQGTSPDNFRQAAGRVRDLMAGAAENARQERSNRRARELLDLGLGRSFRTAQQVLDFVDSAIAGIGHEGFGLNEPPDRHIGEDRPGYVSLWQPIGAAADDVEDDEEGAEGWLAKPDRQMAERIARQVAGWLDPGGPGFPLHKGGKRRAGAGDIMVLVRQRKDLAGLIVARLHAAGVPVAGVDRLRLGAPLAVKDLVAALRFAAQPLDDLNLASLLVSPLVGWSQEQLLRHAWRDKNVRLWSHLRASAGDPEIGELLEQLTELLGRADFGTPLQLLPWMLVGPWQARKRLVARLGTEANDPIDELLNAAMEYAATGTPSLAGFLAWFDAGDGELKRESDNATGLVRVMTVHGSKGLQAPIVILADATGDPERAREGGLDLAEPYDPERRIPLPALARDEKVGRIRAAIEANRLADEQEHWRLLYVAMTRAEEALFVGGALGPRDKGVPPAKSWFARLHALFGAEHEVADPIWSRRWDWGAVPGPAPVAQPDLAGEGVPPRLPDWLVAVPRAEPKPPRPLAPSALGEDVAPDPPWPPGAGRDAARRGTLIHKLLERLPDLARDQRESAALAWLERNAPDVDALARAALLHDVISVLDQPAWSDLFAPGSLAEVPIAALVGGQVVAGTIDRLIVERDCVRIVDFKTSRRPPATLDEVPRAILRQMAAYAAALEVTFPGRAIEAALVYTAAPRLIELPQQALRAHKPEFSPPE